MSEKFQAPRGTRDVLPVDQPLWFDTVTRTMESLAVLYDYRRIQTPGFEDTALFQRTAGVGSDVVVTKPVSRKYVANVAPMAGE